MTATFLSGANVDTSVAAAASCPDVEVVFARGTSDKAGFGLIGRAFINSLRWKLRGKTISTYAVDYPASWNFPKSTSQGAQDANRHVQQVAGLCPETKIVLGGMSQGSAVIDLITIGNRRIWFFTPAPLPDTMVNHVAAVAVFGNPSRDRPALGPLTEISPQYGHKAIDLCATGDPYCSTGNNPFAHYSYLWNGMVNEAAMYVARKVLNEEA
ncbi:cutinase family protein [Mycolicibacterium pyrenivorans]|uniref:cutinase family protein n=1 Tax=Mycolicibacterium pyrenivorans TaxID=187102 RepID=UPI0021F37DCE|nr:cutinase family protein [Mycolicibacterium pyrenivorans]